MSWFMAVIVRGAHLDGRLVEDRLGDLLYRLIEATDADAAYERAVELGRAESEEYDDEDGTSVTLAYLGLADLTEIGPDAPGHGTIVYSQLLPHRPSEMVVTAREELTVFEPADSLESEDDEGGDGEQS